MTKPALTRNAELLVGGPTWLSRLSTDAAAWTLNDTVTAPGSPAAGIYWVEKDLTAYDRSLNVPTIYEGPATDLLRAHETGIMLAISTGEWDGGDATWQGLPSQAPVEDRLTRNVNFLPAEPWAAGSVAVPFSFSSGNVSVTLPTFTNDQRCFIAVTQKSTTANRTYTVGGGGVTANAGFTAPGIQEVSLDSFGNEVTDGTLTVATLTSGQTTTGFIVIGSTYALPDGRTA